jgi:bacteriorhodopsin
LRDPRHWPTEWCVLDYHRLQHLPLLDLVCAHQQLLTILP